jgi:acyl-CoA synthetase (NDP forming)/RimJ/RimL family protein N-acetyltransferase
VADDASTTGSSTTEIPMPPAYPSRWDSHVVLADGGTARVRPIRPDDAGRIRAFHARQSPESIYFRYFSPHPSLSETEVERLVHVDYEDRMAFVALRDDVMVGVARYDRWPTRSEAEVAFFVDDAHRGRGLATILLEYLAVAAREVGISAFTATVLPSNRRMVTVFQQAGFGVRSQFADGVIEVHLGLQPTPEAEAAIEVRARRAEARAVHLLMAPRSVAVVGASRERGSVGHAVLRNLLHHELVGPVYPVNRAAAFVAGVPAYAGLEDIDGAVDLAVICVPADQVPEAMEECGRHDVRAAIVISAGFAESGPEGAALADATLRLARRFGIRLLGPNCLGVINTDPKVRLHATFMTPDVRRGPVGLLAESGTIGAVILDHMGAVELGTSSFAAIGNRADVSANDLLQYWEDDPRTELVLLYLESFGNPRKFGRIARRLSRVKPVVAVQSGRSARAYPEEGDGAASLTPATVEALLRQTGIIRVDTLGQSLDVARVLAGQPLPAGPRVAVVGNAGGSLVTAADACVDAGLELAQPDPGVIEGTGAERAKLRANPYDLGYLGRADHLERLLASLLADDGVDSVLVVCAPSPRHSNADWIAAVEAARPAAPGKTVVASMLWDHPAWIAADRRSLGIPVFDFPDAAAYALGRVTAYARWRGQPEGRTVEPEGAALPDARRLVADVLAPRGDGGVGEGDGDGWDGWLAPPALDEVLSAAGLRPIPSRVVGDIDAAVAAAREVGYPVALKAAARLQLAKSEAAGLALDLHDDAEVRGAAWHMARRRGSVFPAVVQPMAVPGVDVAVSVTQTPLVGPVLGLGAGGVATPVAATQLQVLPLTDLDAARCVAASPVAALLDEAGTERLEDLLLRVGALVEAVPEIVELELNPVIMSADAAAIVEARIRVAPVERDPTPPVRRL